MTKYETAAAELEELDELVDDMTDQEFRAKLEEIYEGIDKKITFEGNSFTITKTNA